jgi:hypothetical protein
LATASGFLAAAERREAAARVFLADAFLRGDRERLEGAESPACVAALNNAPAIVPVDRAADESGPSGFFFAEVRFFGPCFLAIILL